MRTKAYLELITSKSTLAERMEAIDAGIYSPFDFDWLRVKYGQGRISASKQDPATLAVLALSSEIAAYHYHCPPGWAAQDWADHEASWTMGADIDSGLDAGAN